MKNINLAIRKKLFADTLSNIIYQTVKIPVYEDYVQVTDDKPIAQIPYGNQFIEAYIILLNQASNNATNNKCARVDDASIQVQITTLFPANKGGSLIAEEISEKCLSAIYQGGNLDTSITLPDPFNVYKSDVVTIKNMNYDYNTNRAWTTQIVLEFKATQ